MHQCLHRLQRSATRKPIRLLQRLQRCPRRPNCSSIHNNSIFCAKRDRCCRVERRTSATNNYCPGGGLWWTYRLGKLVRRQWLPLTAAALLIAVLLAGILATRRQAQAAEEARARADQHSARLSAERRLAWPGTLLAIVSDVHAPIRGWSATATLVKRLGEPMAHANRLN
jgi:hypothetical protein